ncbi:ABC transporter ATP-binding protein [uncultured Aeromicrobium sp.]|uniref:ABC transporter ATP-binding protein n=1 Tax=uncultured Aeromicrobium sp. TaxID=337820 RepID=UPI0025D607C6|nr:ABC transporter ATP-binding protein [uncultured Aeromicrobium sp.]
MTAPSAGRVGLTGWLIAHTRRQLPPLVVSVLARIANQLLGVALLVTAATAISHAATGRPVEVPALIAWLVGIALVKALLRYLEHYAGHWVAFTSLQRLRELLFARLIPQAPAATEGRAGAELTEHATRAIDRIEVFFAHTLPPAIAAVVVPTVALAWLGSAVDALLAAVLAPFVAATLIVPLAAGSATWRAARRVTAARSAVAARLGDDIQGVREILALGATDVRLDGLEAADGDLAAARSIAGRVQAIRASLTVLVQTLALLAVAAVAGSTGAPLSAFAISLAVAVGLWAPTRGVDDFATGLNAAFAAAERVRAIVDAPPSVRDPQVPGPAPVDAGIDIDQVTLRYAGAAEPAVKAITAHFDAGAWSYVVGVSGSGKSTLATLMLRGRDPDAGTIRLGGADLRELPLDEVRRRIGFVSQRPTLLTGTLADNLRLAAPDADDDLLHQALAAVALDDWAAGLPQHLDTRVRERGLSVSGGQLQRLALARTLLADPEVLVLDEALSQLDTATAALVRQRLRSQRPGLTVIEITHRADLIPDDAHVVVLDRGRVVESGPARDLRATGGPFTRVEARN